MPEGLYACRRCGMHSEGAAPCDCRPPTYMPQPATVESGGRRHAVEEVNHSTMVVRTSCGLEFPGSTFSHGEDPDCDECRVAEVHLS